MIIELKIVFKETSYKGSHLAIEESCVPEGYIVGAQDIKHTL